MIVRSRAGDYTVTIDVVEISCEHVGTELRETDSLENSMPSVKHEQENNKILLLSDNQLELNRIELAVRKSGLTPVRASSPAKAAELLTDRSIVGMLIDAGMNNGVSAIAFLERVGRFKHFEAVPKIAMYTPPMNGSKEEFRDAGFDDFISKPIMVEKVRKALFRNLSGRATFGGR